jgi:hypothetical protein
MDELVIVSMLISKVPEEGGHHVVLVRRARKVGRESASGDDRGNLGEFLRHAALRAADTCHIGTYEVVAD